MSIEGGRRKSIIQHWNGYQPTKPTLAWTCVAAAAATMIVGFT